MRDISVKIDARLVAITVNNQLENIKNTFLVLN